MELREANRLLSASRCAARSKVSGLMMAGTGMCTHSSAGRSTVFTARPVLRPACRATRLTAAGPLTALVLP